MLLASNLVELVVDQVGTSSAIDERITRCRPASTHLNPP